MFSTCPFVCVCVPTSVSTEPFYDQLTVEFFSLSLKFTTVSILIVPRRHFLQFSFRMSEGIRNLVT